MVLEQRKEFTEKECELVAGHPYDEIDQDSYEDLMTMEDKEIRFWVSVNKLPNFMEQDEWDVIVKDYHERMAKEREDGIKEEKLKLDAIIQTLEVKDLSDIEIYGNLPRIIEVLVEVIKDENGVHQLKSNKWDVILCEFNDMWKYEDIAKERQEYYLTNDMLKDNDRFEKWLDFQAEKEFMGISGKTSDGIQLDMNFIIVEGKHRKIGAKEWRPLNEPLEEELEESNDEVDVEDVEDVEDDTEVTTINKWMSEKGFIVWMGNSYIMQKWIDNNEPYDRMAIPYQTALEFYSHRDDAEEMKKAVSKHKLAVKEAKGGD